MSPEGAVQMHYKVKIINLSRANTRRESMERQLQNAGLMSKNNFFVAIEGKSLQHNHADEIRQATKLNRYLYRTGMSWNEVGCFLSHRTLWQELVNDEAHDFYVILEDDVTIHPDLARIVQAILGTKDINFVRLHTTQNQPTQGTLLTELDNGFGLFVDFGFRPHLVPTLLALFRTKRIFYRWFFGGAGYVISKEGARRFLAQNDTKIRRPIDEQMQRLWEHKLPPLVVSPLPVWVGDEHPSGIARKDPATLVHQRFSRTDPRHEVGRLLRFAIRRANVISYFRLTRSWRRSFGAPTTTLNGHLPPAWYKKP